MARHADESQAGTLTWLLNLGCDRAPPAVAPGPGRSAPAARSWPLAALVPPDAPAGVADLAARGAWCFPLTAQGGPLGLLILGGPHGGRPSRDVQGLAEDLAGRIALALENTRLAAAHQQASEALRATLVPPELPRIPGVELAFAHDLPGPASPAFPGPTWAAATSVTCSRWPGDAGDSPSARCAGRVPPPWR